MNIVFLNSIGINTWGGGEKWMLITAKGLREKGHRVYFLGRKGGVFIKRCAEANFPVFPLKIGGDFDPWTIFRLAKFFWQQKVDIVIGNFNKDCRLAGLARRVSRVKAVVARNGLPIVPNTLRYRLTYQWLVNGVITNTEVIKRRYMSYGWMREGLVKVIHNGVELPPLENFNREEICSRFRVPANKKIIGIFGRLVPQKQHHLFVDLAQRLLQEYTNIHFLVVGDGPLKPQLEENITQKGLREHFTLTGHQKDPFPLHFINDLLLLTSDDEGMPNVVMEAMGMLTPVVAFDVGGVRELIPSPELGRVVPRNNLERMHAAVKELLTNQQLSRRIAQQGQDWIRREFSISKMVDDVETYLQQLVNR